MGIKHGFLYGRNQQQLFSLPNLIRWGDHFSVDHSGIDAQHKKIFNLGLTVYENWGDGCDIDMINPSMEKLAVLLEEHFLYEEGILDKIGYEDLDEHVAEHHSILKDMVAMKEKINEHHLLLKGGRNTPGGSVLALERPVMQFFMGFALWHVTYTDMRYCKALTGSRNTG